MTLEIKNLRKAFQDVEALKALDFSLEPGGSLALLGPNGAGKSTAIKILVTLLKPDAGVYLWEGEDLFLRTHRIRELTGYVSQELAMDKVLTGVEFMQLNAGLLHLNWKQHRARAMDLLNRLGLSEAENRTVGTYSGGMKRRLDLAVSLLNEPRILVLDEPTTGLDLEARELIWGLIRDFLEKGGMLVLASHDFREVQELAKEILILEKGEVTRRGGPEALKRDLGHHIIRLKTREYMAAEDLSAVRRVFQPWGDEVVWYPSEDHATLALKQAAPMRDIQDRIYRDMKAAGLNVHTLYLQKPDLEDVYRLNLGGAS